MAPFVEEFARALQRREQSRLVALVAVELGLLGLLLRPAWIFAAQAEVTIEAELQSAGPVLVQLVDDRALPRPRRLEEGHLALRLEVDDLPQLGAADGRLANAVGVAFLVIRVNPDPDDSLIGCPALDPLPDPPAAKRSGLRLSRLSEIRVPERHAGRARRLYRQVKGVYNPSVGAVVLIAPNISYRKKDRTLLF